MATKYQLNQEAAEAYIERFSQTLCSQVFGSKTAVTGPEIIEVAPERQINLFIMRNLYEKWQAETLKLKSPYFDFAHPEVATALRSFMNLLSQHILVRREHFEQLLKQSLRDTLRLVFTPEEFLKAELEALATPKVKQDSVRNLARYVTLNKVLLEGILEHMEATRSSDMFVGEVIRHLLKALHDKAARLHAPEALMISLGEVEPVTVGQLADRINGDDRDHSLPRPSFGAAGAAESFFAQATASEAVGSPTPEELPDLSATAEASETVNDFELESANDQVEEEPIAPTFEPEPEPVKAPEPPAPVAETKPTQPEAKDGNINKDSKPAADSPVRPQPALRPGERPAGGYTIIKDSEGRKEGEQPRPGFEQPGPREEKSGVLSRFFKKKEEPEPKPVPPINKGKLDISHTVMPAQKRTVAELAQRQQPTLNDSLKKEESTGVQAQIANKQALKERIALNDRMRYIKDLFHGDADGLNRALDELEAAGTRHKAFDLVMNNYAIAYDWDLNREPATSFIQLIERKYAEE